MINATTGEVDFSLIQFQRHASLDSVLASLKAIPDQPRLSENHPRPGFTTLAPENRLSSDDYGEFVVDCTFDAGNHLVLVTISHENDFYTDTAKQDNERQIYHESIVTKQLKGQREFSWGEVLYFLCEETVRHYLGVFYTPGTGVPGRGYPVLSSLTERAPLYDSD